MRSQSVCSEKTISRTRRTPITFRPSSRRLQFDCNTPTFNSSRHGNKKVDRICRLFGDTTDISPFPKLSRSDEEALFTSNKSLSNQIKQSKETDKNICSPRSFFTKSHSFCSKPLVPIYNECLDNFMSFDKDDALVDSNKHEFQTVHQNATFLFSEQNTLQRNQNCHQKTFFKNTQMEHVLFNSSYLKDSSVKNMKECFSKNNFFLKQCEENHSFTKKTISANEIYVSKNTTDKTLNNNMYRRVTPVLVDDCMKNQMKEKCKQVNVVTQSTPHSFCLLYETLVKHLYHILLKDTNKPFSQTNKNHVAPFVLCYKLVYKTFEKLVNNIKQADILLIPIKHTLLKFEEKTQWNDYYIEDCIVTMCCPYDHVENDTILCELYRWAFLLVMFYRLHVSSCACFLSQLTESNQFFFPTIITNIVWGFCHSMKGRILLLKETCQIVNDLVKAINELRITSTLPSELSLHFFHEHFETCLHETILSIISFIKSCPDQLVYRFHTQTTVDKTQPLCFVCTRKKEETLGKNLKFFTKPILSVNIPYDNLLCHLLTLLKTSFFYPYKCCLLLMFCSQIHWLLLFYVESHLTCELESLFNLSVWCFQNVCKSLHTKQQEDPLIPNMDSLFHHLYGDKTLYKFFSQSYNHFYNNQGKKFLKKSIHSCPQDFLSQYTISDWNHVSFEEWQHDKNVIHSIIEMACNVLIVSEICQTQSHLNSITLSCETKNHTRKSCTPPFTKNSSICRKNSHPALSLHTRLQSFMYYICMFCTSCFYTQRHCLHSGEMHSLLRTSFSMSKLYRQFGRNYLKHVKETLKFVIKHPTLSSSSLFSLTYYAIHDCCFLSKSVTNKKCFAIHSTNVMTYPFSYHSVLKSSKPYFKIKTPQFMSVQENLITLMFNLGHTKKRISLISTPNTTLEYNSKFPYNTSLETISMVQSPCQDGFEKQSKISLLHYLVYLTHSLCSAYNIYERFTTTLKAYEHQSTLYKKKIKKKKILLKKLKRKRKKITTIHSEPLPASFSHFKPSQEPESVMQCCPCILWLLTYCDIKYNKKDCWQHTIKVSGEMAVEPDVEASVEPDLEASVEPDLEASVEPDLEPLVEPDLKASIEPDLEASVEPDINKSKIIYWTLRDTSLCSNCFLNNENKCQSKKNVNEWRHFISKEKSIPWKIAVHCLRFICESGRALHEFFTQEGIWIEIVSSSECPLNFLYQPLVEKKNLKHMGSQSINMHSFQYLSPNKSFIKVLIFFEALCALSRVTSHMTAGRTFFYTIQIVLPDNKQCDQQFLKRLPNSVMLQLTKSQLNPFFLPLYDNIATISSRTLKSTLMSLLNQEIMTESRILAEKDNESLILFRTLLVDVLSSLLCISLKSSFIKSQNVCDQILFGVLRSVMKLFQFRNTYLFLSINSFNNASAHVKNPMSLMLSYHKLKPCSNDFFLTTSLNITRQMTGSSSFTIPWCLTTLVHFLKCIANVQVEPFATDAAHFIEDLVLSFFPTSALASEKYFSYYSKRKQKHERLGKCGASWISLARNKLLEGHKKRFQCDWNFKSSNGFDKFSHPSIHPYSFFQDTTILEAYFHFEEEDLSINKTTLTCNYILTFFPLLQICIFSIPFNKLFIFVSRIISRIGRYLTQFSNIQRTVLCSLIIHSVWTRLQQMQNLNLEILCTFLSTCSLPFIATEDPFQLTFQSRDLDNLWVEFSSSNTPVQRTNKSNPRCVYLQLWMASLFHLLKLIQNVVYWIVSQDVWCHETNNKWNHLIKSMECVSTYYCKQIQKCVILKQYLCDHSINLHGRKTLRNNCFFISLHHLYNLYDRLMQMLKEENGNDSVHNTIANITFKHESPYPHFLTSSSIKHVYKTIQCTESKQQYANSILQTSTIKDRYCSATPQNSRKIHQKYQQDSLSHCTTSSVPSCLPTTSQNDDSLNLLDLFHVPESESSSITLHSDSEDFYETQVENKSFQEQETHLDDLNEWVVYDQMDLNVVRNPSDMPAKKFIENDLNNYSLDPLWSVYIADMFCNSLH